MPREKRPLSEVDGNASTASRKSAKIVVSKLTKETQEDGVNNFKKPVSGNANQKPQHSKPPAILSPKVQKDGAKGAKEAVSRHADEKPRPSKPAILPLNSSRKWSTPGTIFNTNPPSHREQLEEEEAQKEQFEYSNKDNSKLRRFLSERYLSTSGTREELIKRLENSSINYEDITSAQLSEMLKGRHVTMSAQGTKEYKIQRLRLNDKVERDTGTSEESVLYGTLSAMEYILQEALAKRDVTSNYSTLKPKQLSALLERRKLSQSGTQATLIKRLQTDDRKSTEKRIESAQTKYNRVKNELELKTGRSVIASDVMERESSKHAFDLERQHAAQRPLPKPICDYDWKGSHWADRTERELYEICSRRGMPGHGPKAAMLKWLDTGDIEYEDMYIGGLTSICRERGVAYKDSAKKMDLVRLLREADEAEG